MLSELCCCYSLCPDLIVFNHAITPTEFLLSHLEIRLSEYATTGEGGHDRICLNYVMSPEGAHKQRMLSLSGP